MLPVSLHMLFSALLAAVGAIIIYKFGHRIGSMDIPNERSSHDAPIPRGGGIGIWFAFMITGFLFTRLQTFVLLAGIVGVIGFLEDRYSFLPMIRLLLQLVISSVVVGLFYGVPHSFGQTILFFFWVIFIAGTTNFFNFMDGINGIAGLTGGIGFGLLAFLSLMIANEPDVALMSLVMAAGCLGFLPFNFPEAKVFMGDVGSVFLGFVFASFAMKLSSDVNLFLCIVMFMCMFYADACVTLFTRWKKRENLMTAHRSHLYQYMSNELKLPHWKVSVVYALTQLVFGLLALFSLEKGLAWQFTVFVVFGIMFIAIYKVLKSVKSGLTASRAKEMSA